MLQKIMRLRLFIAASLDDSPLDCLPSPRLFLMSHYLLYLDFDQPIDLDELATRMINVGNMSRIKLERLAVHMTRRGYHVVVNAEWLDKKEMTPAETVALQLLLGSDVNREALNLMRAHLLGNAPTFWRDRWNVLYSEKL